MTYLKIEERELLEDFTEYLTVEKPINVIKLLDIPVKELKTLGLNNEGIIN